MLSPHPELPPHHVHIYHRVFWSRVPMSLYSHACTSYLGLVVTPCVPSPSIAHQLVSLEKGYLFLHFAEYLVFVYFVWSFPRIFHCFLLMITMIISYHGVFWLGQLRRFVSITLFFWLRVSLILSLHISNMFSSFDKIWCPWVILFACGSPSIIPILISPGLMCDAGAILACLFELVLCNFREKALMFFVTLADP